MKDLLLYDFKTKALIYWSKLSEAERKMLEVRGKLKKNDDDIFNLSESNMAKMKANIGDFVYRTFIQK